MSAMCGSVSTSEVLGGLTGPQNLQPGELLHISDPNLNDIEMSHSQPPAIDAPFQFGSSDHSTSYFARDKLFGRASNGIVSQTGEIDETNATMEETTGFDPLSSVALFTFPLDSTVDQTGGMNGTSAAMQETTGLDPLSSDALFISQIDSILDPTGEIDETNATTEETTGFDPLSSVALFTFPLDSTVDQTGGMNGTSAAMQETTGLDPLSSNALFISQIDSTLHQTGKINETDMATQETIPLISDNSTGQAGQAEQETAKNILSALFPDFQTDSISSEAGQMPLTPHTTSSDSVIVQASHNVITV
ncbi:hypothetical protein N7533_011016 [Penicillium manginii]|uniref:uncharacterized protein n=1 Tax=Penicillium manginii TaxID=203109 RepID=UPI0025475B02|nr:uncharacterized protein N7533_011016 [Penicillium manginii]KAJ5741607.1 hypothetical protein N7533_011016 [Penicillium manginii]